MKLASFEKTMFRIAFEATAKEQRRMLDFLMWLREENATYKILEHPLGPHKIWSEWANDTFVGFSTGKIMLSSGCRFAQSERVPTHNRHWWQPVEFDPKKSNRSFCQSYPDYKLAPVHNQLHAMHPAAFHRAAEAFMLSDVPKADRMLEVGPGNCIHVAYRQMLNPGMKTTTIDLPESMFVGWLLLRTMGIDATLPNESHEAPVTMRLPYQQIEGDFDLAFNMGSFQEMSMDTIAGYFALFHATCRATQNVNFEKSRYIEGNEPRKYPYRNPPTFKPAPFHTSLSPSSIPPVFSAVERT